VLLYGSNPRALEVIVGTSENLSNKSSFSVSFLEGVASGLNFQRGLAPPNATAVLAAHIRNTPVNRNDKLPTGETYDSLESRGSFLFSIDFFFFFLFQGKSPIFNGFSGQVALLPVQAQNELLHVRIPWRNIRGITNQYAIDIVQVRI